MSAPTTDKDDVSEEFQEELGERAEEVLDDGDSVTLEEHNAQRN